MIKLSNIIGRIFILLICTVVGFVIFAIGGICLLSYLGSTKTATAEEAFRERISNDIPASVSGMELISYSAGWGLADGECTIRFNIAAEDCKRLINDLNLHESSPGSYEIEAHVDFLGENPRHFDEPNPSTSFKYIYCSQDMKKVVFRFVQI
ncbi:hypothetical protein [Persicirhabdus sediminis]|uniref:Uncharacterized protein n=1 Tax=Persicirhabdus sediminis TaxID=454144 RepID=A0A8J7MGP7_9BACT|nr:hypothetical protein [Persicirhabdus sediminis]MBK1791494.1 hypothetical protein [Persicirhabdus sediminis]